MSNPLPLDDWGGTGPVLHFAHANGFPPGVYRQLFERLTPRAHVVSTRSRCLIPGTEPRDIRVWDDLADDVAGALLARGHQGVVGVGHSVGGVATLLASLKHPGLFRALVMLDPTLLSPSLFFFLGVAGAIGLRRRMPPASLARRRRDHWGSREEAARSYGKKPLFRRFGPEAIQDYVTHGLTEAAGGGFQLTIPRAWEAHIFETSPRAVWQRLREVKVPTLVLRGQESDTLTAPSLERVRRTLPGVVAEELPGTHLFPLEIPEACGERILAFLDTQG